MKYIEQFRECKKSNYVIFPGKRLETLKGVSMGTGYTCPQTGDTCGANLCPAIEHFAPPPSTSKMKTTRNEPNTIHKTSKLGQK